MAENPSPQFPGATRAMSASHLIPLSRLNAAVRLVARGFGSGEAEVEAVAET